MPDPFLRFTERARKVLTYAQVEAHHLKHGYVGTEHLLLGLVREGAASPRGRSPTWASTSRERAAPSTISLGAATLCSSESLR